MPLCLYSTSVQAACMPFLVLPVEWAVPPSMGQLAVLGKAELAKAIGRASIAVAAEISTRRRIFFSIQPSKRNSDFERLTSSRQVESDYFGFAETDFRATKRPYTKLPEA